MNGITLTIFDDADRRRAAAVLRRLADVLEREASSRCPRCEDAETVRCDDPGCEPGDADHEHWIECPVCAEWSP